MHTIGICYENIHFAMENPVIQGGPKEVHPDFCAHNSATISRISAR